MLAFLLSGVLVCGGCGGASGGKTPTQPMQATAATPGIKTTAAQNGAVIVSLSTTTSGATIYYTLDGSAPATSSQIYEAPFLVASNWTVKAMATAPGDANSSVASQSFAPNIASGTLVWSDEFTNSGGTAFGEPNPGTWTYDVGTNC